MGHGQGAQGVLGGLDEGVFEGMRVVGGIGDNLQHSYLLLIKWDHHPLLSNKKVAAVYGLTDRSARAKPRRTRSAPHTAAIKGKAVE
jgi:hypothetical protein